MSTLFIGNNFIPNQQQPLHDAIASYIRGGGVVFQGGYHPRKTKHVIRVVFQDQAMYARTSFRGAKTSKIGKKGVFLAMVINFGKRWRKIKKKTCKNAYLGSIFIPGKYVFRVCFESPFTRMISNLKYKCPRGLYKR